METPQKSTEKNFLAWGVFAFVDPATTGIGFVLFFIAGCLHILVNIIFQKN